MRPHCRIRTVGGAVYIFSVLSTRVTPPYATGRPCHPITIVAANSQIATGTFFSFFNLNYNIKHFEHDLWVLCTFTTLNKLYEWVVLAHSSTIGTLTYALQGPDTSL